MAIKNKRFSLLERIMKTILISLSLDCLLVCALRND